MTVRRHAPSVRGRRVDDRVKGNKRPQRRTGERVHGVGWSLATGGTARSRLTQTGHGRAQLRRLAPKTAEAKLHGEDAIMGRGRLQDAAQLAEHGRLQDAAQLAEHGRLQDAAQLAERIEQTNGLKLDTRKTEAL